MSYERPIHLCRLSFLFKLRYLISSLTTLYGQTQTHINKRLFGVLQKLVRCVFTERGPTYL